MNALVSIGCSVSESEHIEVILKGLSTKYNAFVTSITTRIEPYSVAQVEAQLLAHEARIEQATQKLNLSSLQAHVANRDTNVASGDLSGSVHSKAPQMFSGYRGGRFGGRGF